MKAKNRQLRFYILMLIFPLAQFAVFYIGVNFNSFLLAFKNYDVSTSTFLWCGVDNFKRVWQELTEFSILRDAFENSLIVWFFTSFTGTVAAVFFSYYIYKRFSCYGFYKVILFIPSILPSIILVMIFRTFVNEALSAIGELWGMQIEPMMKLDSPMKFPMAAFFSVWASFGTQVLLYTGTMEQISPSVIEAGKLDGAMPLREFWSIVLPEVMPAVNTFLVAGIAQIFINQANLWSFYSGQLFAEDRTLGYYMFYLVNKDKMTAQAEYGYASALGLCCTLIAIPLTWIVRRILTKLEER